MLTPSSPRWRLLIVGVGGQGVLTTARILGEAALAAGLDVSVGQLHGMAQRGGSVEASVVIGAGSGALAGSGEPQVLVALEPLEALRARSRITQRTAVLIHRGTVAPLSLALAGRAYPDVDGIVAELRARAGRVFAVGPASSDPGVFMLGALARSGLCPVAAEKVREASERGGLRKRAARAGAPAPAWPGAPTAPAAPAGFATPPTIDRGDPIDRIDRRRRAFALGETAMTELMNALPAAALGGAPE